MNLSRVEEIKENLRSFRFDVAFPMLLNAVEELAGLYRGRDTRELNEIMLLVNDAMENRDVIRLCDITEFIIYPQFPDHA